MRLSHGNLRALITIRHNFSEMQTLSSVYKPAYIPQVLHYKLSLIILMNDITITTLQTFWHSIHPIKLFLASLNMIRDKKPKINSLLFSAHFYRMLFFYAYWYVEKILNARQWSTELHLFKCLVLKKWNLSYRLTASTQIRFPIFRSLWELSQSGAF